MQSLDSDMATTECRCDRLPLKSVLVGAEADTYAKHLRFLVGSKNDWLPSYYFCPNTLVLWKRSWRQAGWDWRQDEMIWERMDYIPIPTTYTVAEIEATLYAEPIDTQISTSHSGSPLVDFYPILPLQCLICDDFSTRDILCFGWQELQIEEVGNVRLWVDIFGFLERGKSVQGWACSLLEPLNEQLLRVEVVLDWTFLKQIGEIRIKRLFRLDRDSFSQHFGSHRLCRDLPQEREGWWRR